MMSSFGENERKKIMKICNFSVEIIIRIKVLPAMAPQFSTEQRICITLEYWDERFFFQKYDCGFSKFDKEHFYLNCINYKV